MSSPRIVNSDWLSDHITDSDVVAVDVRPPHFYRQGHLPRAVNLPVFFLYGPNAGPPESAALANRLGVLGITADSHVVAHDEAGGSSAARLYWLLRYYCHPRVSVLDGGITEWRHRGLDWEYEPPQPSEASYEAHGTEKRVLATLDDVREAIGNPDAIILDVRTPAEYLGLQMTAARNGHVPSALNVDSADNYQQTDHGLLAFKSPEELRALYSEAGATPDKRIITYCQSGGRSAATLLVLEHLGYQHVSMYSEGWQEWGNRSDTPVEE